MNKKDILIIIETVLIIILLINSIIYMVIAKDLSDCLLNFLLVGYWILLRRMEMNKQLITIKLKDKETGIESKPVDIEKVIFNQYDIEFEFGEPGDEDYGTLPYKDFLFFRDDYEVIINVKES